MILEGSSSEAVSLILTQAFCSREVDKPVNSFCYLYFKNLNPFLLWSSNFSLFSYSCNYNNINMQFASKGLFIIIAYLSDDRIIFFRQLKKYSTKKTEAHLDYNPDQRTDQSRWIWLVAFHHKKYDNYFIILATGKMWLYFFYLSFNLRIWTFQFKSFIF